ncbi:restriction endonuclease subunit S [Paraburkholderia sp. RCC_158]|uniref:restriction endonuclease subunit S n=1 Tax=Paraburkholderia sp. RCC_158 TaxID=3239220 RepID=UPI003523AE26
MSNDATTAYRALSALVTPVDAKITIRKDETRPYIGLEHIRSRGAHLADWALASTSISTNAIFRAGDVLFGKLRPNLRKCVVAPFDGYCSTDILVLRANEFTDPSFAGKVLRSELVGTAAEMTSVGTKMPRTSWKHLSALEVFCPSLREQSKIAYVLDTLDTAIHENEAIIAKLMAVKQGLLHDLLTRGIDANGELRPPQAEAPDLYKSSPLGWIPTAWEVLPLGDLAESLVDGPFGSNLKTAHYVENPGVRVVRLQNILSGEYNDSERAFISDKHAASLSRNRVVGGDVLIASLGDAGYPVGRSCCYPTTLPDAVNKADCFRFRANSRCRNQFVMLSMNGSTARVQIRRYEQGVTMKRINLGNLRRIDIALPAIAEQDIVIERMEAIRLQIEVAQLEYQKLQNEKSGLMDDLLTGRVRVTPLLIEDEQQEGDV